MDYSAINHAMCRLGLEEDHFVIGGPFAAGLSEPKLAKAMGNAGRVVHLFVSSHNFEVIGKYEPSGSKADVVRDGDDKLTIHEGGVSIILHRGIPSYWLNKDGYKVQNPLPLKRWLGVNGLADWVEYVQDVPFEKRLEGLALTKEEEEFKQSCINHDWYSDFSDSPTVARRGATEYKELLKKRDQVGGNAHLIFDYYRHK